MNGKQPQTTKYLASAKRLLSLALALVMVLATAAPAMAADTVRIFPNANTSTPTDTTDAPRIGRFIAYQIFTGDLDDNYENGGGINDPPVINNLSDIGWGSSIQAGSQQDLIDAMKAIDTPVNRLGVKPEMFLWTGERYLSAEGLDSYRVNHNNKGYWVHDTPTVSADDLTTLGRNALLGYLREDLADDTVTLGGLFEAALAYEQDNDSGVEDVAVMAAVLSDFTDPTGNTLLGELFASLVCRRNDDGSYRYLDAPYVTSGWDDAAGHNYWTVTVNEGGFYLIVDEYTLNSNSDEDKGTAQSDYVLAVLGSQDIYVKTYAPSMKKVIANADNGNTNGDDFDFTDTIIFRLTGTLPENLNNYKEYHYIFTDTMAAGLSYLEGSMQVYAVAPGNGGIYLLTPDPAENPDPNLVIQTPGSTETDIVRFTDLKKITTGTRVSAIGAAPGAAQPIGINITGDWEIVVQYQAKIAENVAFGPDSLIPTNTSSTSGLTYSSSVPNPINTNLIPSVTDYIYNFGLDVLKYDGTLVTNEMLENGGPLPPLEDVGFTLTRKNTTGYSNITYYAFGDPTSGVIWASLAELNAYLNTPVTASQLNRNDFTVGMMKAGYNGPLPRELSNKKIAWDNGEGGVNTGHAVTDIRRMPAYGSDAQYAVLEKDEADSSSPVDLYSLYAWISGNELAKYLGVASAADIDWDALKEDNGKLGQPVEGYTGSLDRYAGKYVCVFTGDKSFHISGLKDETYTLSEVSAPDPEDNDAGWEFLKLEDITIELAAEYYSPALTDGVPGSLKNLYYMRNGSYQEHIVRDGAFEDGFDSLSVSLELSNITSTTMPINTGGIGAFLFYAAGGALVAGAVLLLAYSRRKEKLP